jgi:hypothetical protein
MPEGRPIYKDNATHDSLGPIYKGLPWDPEWQRIHAIRVANSNKELAERDAKRKAEQKDQNQ